MKSMIDMIRAEKAFKKYVEAYDVTDAKIEIKIAHTYRTVAVAKKIAQSLHLLEEDVELAGLIGLLHDIGRFEQLRIYDTFDDLKSVDHADFSVSLLFEQGLIKEFIESREYDDLIRKAIQNHNKYKIEEGLNERELLHAKLIRDADKTDIYEVHVKDIVNEKNVLYDNRDLSKHKISPQVLEDFIHHKTINKKDCQNRLDNLIVVLAFLYDFNFEAGLEIIIQRKYLDTLLEQVERYAEDKKESDIVRETTLQFLQDKIETKV